MGKTMFLRFILGLFLIALSPLSVAADAATEAKKNVDLLNSTLIEVMKEAKQLGYEGRYKKLEPVVKEVFEFEAVSQIALGNHWKKLDRQQKTAFIEKLTDLSIATYAAQFNDHSGEEFKYDSAQDMKSDRVLLRYFLTSPNEKPIKFEYIVNEFNGQWRIINIIVDGISDLALKKAQYTSVIDREGFDSLLNKLSQKIADYSSNNSTSG
ncbi:HpnM family protein [Methylocaldum sp.]|uniref:HpnM family protein n=1 Tax=Methylocaldum sp. TaxID=1969727 RepID=UPI002D2B6093|nr:HpnM family protein [Methylocaldum sp.]HYE36808.1 HpnM family protein [Methylocaldum sp.]